MQPEKIDVGWIDPENLSGHFAHSIAVQVRDMEYHGCMGKVMRHSASQPIVARNNLIREYLETSDSPWLWMVDADMVFDKGHAMKLWLASQEADAKMVTGLAFIFKDSKLPVPSLFYDREDSPGLWLSYNTVPHQIAEVAACGLASVLVHREVLESLQAPRHADYRWFDFLLNKDVGIEGDEMTGIDVQFFMRARALGYKLVVEPAAETHHLEQIGVDKDAWIRANQFLSREPTAS